MTLEDLHRPGLRSPSSSGSTRRRSALPPVTTLPKGRLGGGFSVGSWRPGFSISPVTSSRTTRPTRKVWASPTPSSARLPGPTACVPGELAHGRTSSRLAFRRSLRHASSSRSEGRCRPPRRVRGPRGRAGPDAQGGIFVIPVRWNAHRPRVKRALRELAAWWKDRFELTLDHTRAGGGRGQPPQPPTSTGHNVGPIEHDWCFVTSPLDRTDEKMSLLLIWPLRDDPRADSRSRQAQRRPVPHRSRFQLAAREAQRPPARRGPHPGSHRRRDRAAASRPGGAHSHRSAHQALRASSRWPCTQRNASRTSCLSGSWLMSCHVS